MKCNVLLLIALFLQDRSDKVPPVAVPYIITLGSLMECHLLLLHVFTAG